MAVVHGLSRSAVARWGSVAAVTVLVAVSVVPGAAADGPSTFSNTAAIAIPATGSANQIGPASPYPSDIPVTGMAGLVTTVQVRFNGLTHSTLNDIDAMVVAPTGENLVVLSDIGDPTTTLAFANNATLTFSDSAAGPVPTGNVPTGTYRPTNNGGGDNFPAPAPSPSTQTTLAGAFSGINPNGTWHLYAVDDATGDVGTMAGGWSLIITTEVAAVATSTTVTTSGSPSTTGAPVTFSATVTAAGSPVSVGSVQFSDGTTALGAPVALSGSGVASLTTSALTEGTHSIRATFSGAPGFLTSNGTVTQRVDNQTVVDGNTYCNTGPITPPAAGAAQPYPSHITVSGLGGPVTKVTATLKGLSHSAPIDFDVLLSGPQPTTNLVLLSDAGGQAAVSNLNLTFDDAAAGPVPAPAVTGTFRPTDLDPDGQVDTFPAPAPSPSAATTLSTFNGATGNGVWSLWVVDDATGDSGSIANGWCLTIESTAPTATVLSSSVNPSVVGGSVTFTATVTAGGAPVSAGSVQFSDGGSNLGGAVPVDAAGTATFTTSALTVGTHPISAGYGGTSSLQPSSGDVSQVVGQQASTTVLSSSVNPSVVGGSVTFTATVTAGGAPVTAGSVQFSDGGSNLGGAVPVDAAGTATLTTSALTVGTHPISAAFSGTAELSSSSDDLDQAVDPVADAGGPYTVAEGASLTLDASGSTSGAGYAWDLNGDGDFTDATGAAPTLTWTELEALGIDDGPATHTVTLEVTEAGRSATDTVDLQVTNTAPISVLTGGLTATVGVPFTIKVGADDPSSADMAADFSYTIDWGDGSPVESLVGPADPPVTHTYTAAGSFGAAFTATDKDGGQGAPTSVQVLAEAASTTTSSTRTAITSSDTTTASGSTSSAAPTSPGTTVSPTSGSTTTASGSTSTAATTSSASDTSAMSAPPLTPTTPGDNGGDLPATGSSVGLGAILAGAALVLAGAVLMIAARRRRPGRHQHR